LSTPATTASTSASSSTDTSTSTTDSSSVQSASEKLLTALIRLQEQAFQSQSTDAASLAA
jgi:hypothetical protein